MESPGCYATEQCNLNWWLHTTKGTLESYLKKIPQPFETVQKAWKMVPSFKKSQKLFSATLNTYKDWAREYHEEYLDQTLTVSPKTWPQRTFE